MANHRPPKPGLGVQIPPPPHMLEINKNLEFLRKKSKKVDKITDETKSLVLGMMEAMNHNQGVGLAAPQVNSLQRIIVVKNNSNSIALINPVIIKKSKNKEIMEEGCLSIPECSFLIKRFKEIDVKFIDLDGQERKEKYRDLLARIIQHEIDHLNGILIFNRAPIKEKIKKLLFSK